MIKVLQYAFLNYLLTMWYDSGSSYSSHMHLVSTIAFSLEFLTLLGRRFCACFGRFIWKRVVGFQFHTCILYCWLWGFGGDWLTCGFGGIQKLWFFWGLRLCQCLGHHSTHLLPRYSIHIVSSCFIPFILGRGGNVCLHDDQKTTGYCLTEYSCIVQLSYIAHLPQIHPLFNFASSSIVQLFYIAHLPQIYPFFNFASSSIVQLP